ncbi:MAG: 4Fe-4S binding protein [Candidatus Eisenbacteria bacterium]|nr:4Fe-4S binding protein [Candidatus Eisenbacteria bacterium]
MRALRSVVQFLFLGGTVALLLRGLAGVTTNTCESYCPFGGLVAIFPLAKHGGYACALTELNVALFVSLVGLALLSKKSFCSWICPLGTVQEWIGRGGRKLFGRACRDGGGGTAKRVYRRVPRKADRWLVLVRYAVLIAIPVLTYTVWQYDLGFRKYDPFYILFTWGGHETAAFSFYVVIGVLAAAFFLPFAWCRYLCPLGAAMDPLSRAGGLRLRRNTETCTDCGACDAACPHAIPVSSYNEVTAHNCTNCMECAEACPEKGTLELSWFGK